MPLRGGFGRRAKIPARASASHGDAGKPIAVGSQLAHCMLDGLRTDADAAADCTERVAAVLQKLGYGFALIPRRQPTSRHN